MAVQDSIGASLLSRVTGPARQLVRSRTWIRDGLLPPLLAPERPDARASARLSLAASLADAAKRHRDKSSESFFTRTAVVVAEVSRENLPISRKTGVTRGVESLLGEPYPPPIHFPVEYSLRSYSTHVRDPLSLILRYGAQVHLYRTGPVLGTGCTGARAARAGPS